MTPTAPVPTTYSPPPTPMPSLPQVPPLDGMTPLGMKAPTKPLFVMPLLEDGETTDVAALLSQCDITEPEVEYPTLVTSATLVHRATGIKMLVNGYADENGREVSIDSDDAAITGLLDNDGEESLEWAIEQAADTVKATEQQPKSNALADLVRAAQSVLLEDSTQTGEHMSSIRTLTAALAAWKEVNNQ